MLFVKNLKKHSMFFGATFFCCTISLGVLSFALWNPKNQHDHYTNYDLKTKKKYHLKIQEVLNSSIYNNQYAAILHSMNDTAVSGKVILQLAIDTTQQNLQIDDELVVYEKLAEIAAPLNPHQFNYKKYLAQLGIYHQLKIPNQQYLVLENTTRTLFGIAASQRLKIISKLQKANFGTDELAIIKALLLGQRDTISEDTYTNYKDAGAVHILAVSGLHIGILLILLQFLLRPLERIPKGKSIKLMTIVLLLWCFALLAGLSPSILRAVTMFSFVAYALYLNRPSNTFNILALSMFFILLLFNPMLIFQVGFQMSYAAVFAIVWLYPKLQTLWFPKNYFVRKIWQLLAVSIAAQMGVLPISLFYFHQFPGLFFLSNLIILPFLGIILGMGILVILLALLNILPDFLVYGYNTLIHLMNTIIAWIAQQEVFLFKNISFDSVQLILSFGIIISAVIALNKATFRNVAFLLITIICFQGWSTYALYNTKQQTNATLLHQSRNTILALQEGTELTFVTSDNTKIESLAKNYSTARRIKTFKTEQLKNAYTYVNNQLLVIDSAGIYPNLRQSHILLCQSPKINLDRLIDSLQPIVIIADGSNYKNYIKRWKATCAKRKLPFHYTGEKGAYYLE